jgi:Recombination endonuclease VII
MRRFAVPWYDLEDFCDVCGKSVPHVVFVKGESVYCSRSCRRREQSLKERTKKYGITPTTFRQMLSDQGGECAICTADLGSFSGAENLMQIDHDHVSGRVRGLLCKRCNTGIAIFRDNIPALERAAEYLRRAHQPLTTTKPSRRSSDDL